MGCIIDEDYSKVLEYFYIMDKSDNIPGIALGNTTLYNVWNLVY